MKFGFDLLEIKTLIEEKRLIFGLKFEKFLLQKSNSFINFIDKLLSSKSCALFGSLVIILISLYIRSSVDIGVDSGISLEIAQKILEGKKLNHDFIEYNFPLTFILLFPPILIANFFKITPIIIADYYINLIGIGVIFWCYKILKNSQQIPQKIIFNLLIIALSCGFFLRVNTLIFNEYLTKTTFLLAVIYPYFCYQIVGIEKLNNTQKTLVGILMAIVVGLKPTNIFLIVGFEIYRFWKTKKITTFFVLHNYIFAIFLSLYGLVLWVFFHNFLENFTYFLKNYNVYRYNYFNLKFFNKYLHFRVEFAMYFVLIYIYSLHLQKSEYLKKILILSISALVLIFSESFYLDQRAVFYALFIFVVLIGFYEFTRQYQISITKNWFILISLAIFLFLTDEFFEIICISSTSIFSLVILMFLLVYKNYIFKKYSQKIKYFTVIFVCFVTLGFISKFVKTVLFSDTKNNQMNFILKSPNQMNHQLMLIKKTYLAENENIITLNLEISESYPFRNYAQISNNSKVLQYDVIKAIIRYPNYHLIDKKFYEIAKEDLLMQLKNPKNKLLINYYNFNCSITILEYFLHDPEINKIFTENFKYLTNSKTFISSNSFIPKYTKEYLSDAEFEIVKQLEFPTITNNYKDEFEAYIRK